MKERILDKIQGGKFTRQLLDNPFKEIMTARIIKFDYIPSPRMNRVQGINTNNKMNL